MNAADIKINPAKIPATDLLNEYRNLIRKELGFGSNIELNREIAWVAAVVCERKNKQEESKGN